MTSPEFEELIRYRRQLRDKQADAVPTLSWGLGKSGVSHPRQRVWHLTVATEPPAKSLCGKVPLVKVVPKYLRPLGETTCKLCIRFTPEWLMTKAGRG